MKIKNSQVADNQSSITNSNNKTTNKKYLKADNIISFILGIIASIIASYIFENFIK